jgi:2-oxo-4-hydroxy-4-carboxy-5-ureidoimidazoline decarboxylase
MTNPASLDEVNALSPADFIARFGDIAEHSAWVAEAAEPLRPYCDHAALVLAFQHAILKADEARQTALILAHPDLAGRAAMQGEVAEESKREQKGAGLDTLTAEEFERFHGLNHAYRARFGFPFIFAVTGATKHQILDAFQNRVGGTMQEERLTAIAQILRIVRFRLETRVSK